MKGGVARPDASRRHHPLAGLDRIERLPDGGVRIGALVRNADLAHDAEFARPYPAVAEALLSGASAQLRNAATVGGNLLQRTRCAYFYDPASACNKREPGAGCDAQQGENRLHAVLGWSESCIATHPSDFCVPLVALDAVVEIEGRDGPARDCARGAPSPARRRRRQRETALEPGELIVAVRLPAEAAAFAGHARYLKVRERTSYAFAVVSAAAGLRLDGNGSDRQARLALGGVAAEAVARPRGGGAVLAGAAADAAAFRRAAEAALADARPSGDNALQDRAGAPDRRAALCARRRRNARARARPARLALLPVPGVPP